MKIVHVVFLYPSSAATAVLFISLSFYSVVSALSGHGGVLAIDGQDVLPIALPALAALGVALVGMKFVYPSIRRTQSVSLLSERSDADTTFSNSAVRIKGSPRKVNIVVAAGTGSVGGSAAVQRPATPRQSLRSTADLATTADLPVEIEVGDGTGSEIVSQVVRVSSADLSQMPGAMPPGAPGVPMSGDVKSIPPSQLATGEERGPELHPDDHKAVPMTADMPRTRRKVPSTRSRARPKKVGTAPGVDGNAGSPSAMPETGKAADSPDGNGQLRLSDGSGQPEQPGAGEKTERPSKRPSRSSKRVSSEKS